MKRIILICFFFFAAALYASILWEPSVSSKDAATNGNITVMLGGDAKHQFIGTSKCKMCHNTEKSGQQYKKWQESKHAQAYKTLGSEKAKKVAKAKGIEDPQKADACLKCHVAGYSAPAELKGEKYSKEEGVTCESCHGAASDYWKKEVMQAAYDKKIDPATVGLRVPVEADCKSCHNSESPFYKEFNFAAAKEKIAHKIPK